MADRMPTRLGVPDDRTRVRMLESFAVQQGASTTTLGGGRAAALVAILALRLGHPVSRAQLIEWIWQDDRPDDSGPALRQLVSRARRVLPEGVLERIDTPGDTAYRLSPDRLTVDVDDFERLTSSGPLPPDESRRRIDAALALVGDSPFSGLPALEVFEDARRSIERHVAELRREKLILDAEECVPAILGSLEASLDESPDDEGLWVATVRYLARTGRSAAAARMASTARRTLRNIGMEPGPALRNAERLALDLGSMSVFRPDRVPPAAPLFGRQREFADAVELIGGTSRGLVVTIWGAPGMGTSSLLRSVAGAAQEAGTPVGYVTSIPAPVRSDRNDEAIEESIARQFGWNSQDGDPLHWMSVVVPAGAVLALDVHLDREDIVGALSRLTTGWPGPIAVAATAPTGLPGEHAIRLGPLSQDAALDFIVDRVEHLRGRRVDDVERTSLSAICDRSGSIPLILELCAHQLATRSAADLLTLPVIPDVAARIDSVVRQLPTEAGETAYRLAWIDGHFDTIDAARLLPRPRPSNRDATEQLGTLVRSGLIEFDPGRSGAPYRMLEPISSALRSSEQGIAVRASTIRRRQLTLAARGRSWAHAIGRPDELAALHMLSDRLPALVEASRDTAAAPAVQRSLLHSTMHILLATGRADEAAQLLDLANVRDTAKADLVPDLAATAYMLDELDLVVEIAERSADLPIPECDRHSIGRHAVRSLRNMGRFADAHRLLDQLTASLAPPIGDEAVSLTMERGTLLVFEDERATASRLLTEARIDFQRLGVLRGVGTCNVYLSWCAWADGNHDRATDLLQRAWDVSIEFGHTADEMFCRSTAARFATERGDHERSLEDCRIVERFTRAAHDRLSTARILEIRAAAEHGLGMPSDDTSFEAAMLRRRLGAPLAPIELRWVHPDRLLTTA